ncbi:MAG: hypothetical protein JJT81_19725 [Rubellimicrobium sp.]|nr:hypothetical protein [Rubellimicrobium sp.]
MKKVVLVAGLGALAGCSSYEVLPHDFEWGGQTADGIFFSAREPGVAVRAVTAPALGATGADEARALAAADAACGDGQVWMPDETNSSPFFFEGIWHLPGRCGEG